MVLENHTQDYIENDILPSKVESLWRKSLFCITLISLSPELCFCLSLNLNVSGHIK